MDSLKARSTTFRRLITDPRTFVRVIIDVVLISLSLLAVLVVHFAYVVRFSSDPIPIEEALPSLRSAFAAGAVILSSISINAFFLSGFYQRTRGYQIRYKLWAIVKTVSASQLMFAFVILMLWDVIIFPRAVLIPGWLLTMGALVVARIYAHRLPIVHRFLSRLDAIDTDRFAASGDRDGAWSTTNRVLVVGGAGYIGSGLLQKLLDRGYQVRLLDTLMFGEEPIKHLVDHPNLEIVRQDFRQVNHVMKAVSEVDAVIHLAAIVGDPACELDQELTLGTNLMATRMLAEVAQCAGVKRFVFASTCSVYGASDEVLDERSKLNPVSLYARSKIACEEVLTPMADENFSPVLLRFGTIYGLSGRTRFDLVVNLLTAKATFDKEITVFGGRQWRPFVHVDDAAAGVLCALEAPRNVVHNRVFNVGSDEQNYTIDQVGELIKSIVPAADLKQMGNDGERRDYRVDFSRIRDELGFRPSWTLEMGIRQVIEAINQGEVIDYTEPRYSNVKSLQAAKALSAGVVAPTDSVAETVINLNYEMPFEYREGAWVTELVRAPDEEPLDA